MAYENELFQAAIEGSIEKINKYLAMGGEITAKDIQGTTLLMFAARHGQLSLVEWLVVEKKLNVTEKNKS